MLRDGRAYGHSYLKDTTMVYLYIFSHNGVAHHYLYDIGFLDESKTLYIVAQAQST